jgi:hypothetical protein
MASLGVSGAEASLLTYDINATYTDNVSVDGTITGSFTVDYAGGNSATVTAVTLASSASGPVAAATYLPANSSFSQYGGTATEYPTSDVWIFSAGALIGGTTYNGPNIDLSFIFPGGSALASYGFGASDLWIRNDGGQSTFFNVTGTATPAAAPAVPEASTWAMIILGFGGLGIMAHRRKPKPAVLAV